MNDTGQDHGGVGGMILHKSLHKNQAESRAGVHERN